MIPLALVLGRASTWSVTIASFPNSTLSMLSPVGEIAMRVKCDVVIDAL